MYTSWRATPISPSDSGSTPIKFKVPVLPTIELEKLLHTNQVSPEYGAWWVAISGEFWNIDSLEYFRNIYKRGKKCLIHPQDKAAMGGASGQTSSSNQTPPSPPPEDLSPVRRRRMRPISEDSEEEVEPQAQRPRIESIPQAPSVEILEEDPEKEDNEMVEQVLQDIMMRRPVTADAFPIARFDAATLQIVPYDPEQKEHSPPITSDPQNIPATDILIPEGTDQSPLDILADAVTQPETNMDQPEEAPLDITEPQTNKDNTSVATEVQTAASDPHTSTTQDFSEEPVTEAEQTNTPAEQINPPSPPATVSDAPQSIILPEYWCHLEILHLQALHLWNPLKTASLPCYASIKFT